MDQLNNEKPKLSIPGIISRSFTLYKNNFVVLAAISAVIVLGDFIYLGLQSQSVPAGFLALFWVCDYIVSIWAFIALINAASAIFQGESIGLKQAFTKARGHFWMYIFVSIFCTLSGVIGSFLLIIPGIYIFVILILAAVSSVIDDQAFFDHLRISKILVRGYFWKVLVLFLTFTFFGLSSGLLFRLNLDIYLITGLMHVVNFFIAPLLAVALVILYHQLHGFKQEELSVFADAREAKGSQLGVGALSCFGLGVIAWGASIAFFFGLTALFQFLPNSQKICPLSQQPKSVVQYLKEDDRLTQTPQEPRVIETEEYSLYIPAGTDIQKKHPMVIVLSPNANSNPIVEAWKPAVDRYKWILYGSKKYSNNGGGMYGQTTRIVSLLDEIYSYFPVDETMVLASGFSGGGMGAHEFAKLYPNLIKAVVTNTGMISRYVYKEKDDYPRGKFAVFLASPTDFRYEEMQQDRQWLNNLEWSTKWIEFQGGHVVAPSSAYLEVGDWLNKHLIEGQPVSEIDPFSELASTEHISDGMIKEFYPNRNVSVEVSYQGGLRHGPYTSYYPNGNVWLKGLYVKGKKHGEFTVYDNDGSLQRITYYQKGQRDGWLKDYEDNSLIFEDLYKNNTVVRHKHYDGKRLDHIEEYESGLTTQTTYFNDQGKEIYSIDYKDGKPQFTFWEMLISSFKR